MQVLIRKTLGVSIMNQYDFTYEIPDDITNQVIRFLQMNGEDFFSFCNNRSLLAI